ncbi:MAG: hypothetical protein HOD52_02120, partial [Candidatus Marinimicrobia bacterium]|nr:hypothetical protein [Candidatus Neomarinimicrobiota bacterium]
MEIKEEDYKKVQDIIDVDVSKLKFYNFNEFDKWYIELFKNHSKFEYYLIFTDYHSSGGCLQFEKSDTNTNSKFISEFKDEYDPIGMVGDEDFDTTNEVYKNNKGFTTFQIYKVTSNKFPELIKNKYLEYLDEMEENG